MRMRVCSREVMEETLEAVVLKALQKRGWSLAVVEYGLNEELLRRLSAASRHPVSGQISAFHGGEVIAELPEQAELMAFTSAYRQARQVEVCLGVAIYPGTERQGARSTADVHLALITPEGQQEFTRPYGGPPEYTSRWALHHSLDLLRNL